MYKIELNETIKRIVKILYQAGVWQSEDESAGRKTARKLFFLIYIIIFQVFNGTSAFLSDDKTESIFLTEVGMIYGVLTFKLVYLLWKKDKILEFLNDPITAHSTEYQEVFEHVNEKLNKFMKFVHAYLFMLTITSSFIPVVCLPLFTAEKKLPYFISMDWTDSEFIYWIAYGFVFLAVICGYLFNLLTVLVWYQMFNYSVAYEVLGSHLKNLGRNKCTESRQRKKSQYTELNLIHRELIDLIKTHRNIIEYDKFVNSKTLLLN